MSSHCRHCSSSPALLLQLPGAGWPEENPVGGPGGRELGWRASKGFPCWLSALHTELAQFHDDLPLSPLLLPGAATSAGIPPSNCLAALPLRFQVSCHSLIPTLAQVPLSWASQDKCPLRIFTTLHCNGLVTFGCPLLNYTLCKRRNQV